MEKISTKLTSTLKSDTFRFDRWPVVLKGLAGFLSCLTVSTTSAIFIYSIHLSITSNVATWPGLLTALIMLAGPVIIAWNFVNAKGIITTILPKEGEVGEREIPVPKTIPIMTPEDVAFERELMGHTSVFLRAIAGFISTNVICYCSLLFTWTIHQAMITGKPLPTDGELLLVVIGPVVTSWNFVRAGATISSVVQGAGNLHRFREKLATIIHPK